MAPRRWGTARRWPTGSSAATTDVLVRQVHDPVRMSDAAGSRVHLTIRWRSLPGEFRAFLDAHVEPGAFVLIVRDVRSWPVLDAGNGYSYQVGSATTGLDLATYTRGADLSNLARRAGGTATWPTGRYRRLGAEHSVEPGVEAGLRDWAQERDGRVFAILYHGAETLSAAVADTYRDWLRAHGKTGNRLIVTAGRLLDPWQTIRAGVVPYWCEASTRGGVSAAELWLAGCRPFSTIEVLPEPPGGTWSQVAPMAQWSALAQFASRRGVVNPDVARAYPSGGPSLRGTPPTPCGSCRTTYPDPNRCAWTPLWPGCDPTRPATASSCRTAPPSNKPRRS